MLERKGVSFPAAFYAAFCIMKVFRRLLNRITFLILIIIFQLLLIVYGLQWSYKQVPYLDLILRILSVVLVLMIMKNSRHLSSDLLWILLIIIFPVQGTAIYLLIGSNLYLSPTMRSLNTSLARGTGYYRQDPDVLKELMSECPEDAGQFRYISNHCGFPFYRNTGYDYYSLGDDGFPVMLEELRRAEKYIFIEYFIIEEGLMWNSILDILKEKAAAGVEVRVIYDDFGSLATLPYSYPRTLRKYGIKCLRFNQVNPILAVVLNHRDHRKIMVIDGRTAFTGGINLADNYINVKRKYGHWKDNVIRIRGEAVWSFVVMFLTHWNAIVKEDDSFLPFKADIVPGEADGFIAPYGETPLDREITSQNIYMGIVNQANDYCYIFTPYLIIDNEFINALVLAAKHGADIRIVTPGIPDKKLVYEVTRSYYRPLLEGGVRIFEYTPGFIHSKVFVSDDVIAAVGTINLDYRSLYLHFENGTFLVNSKQVLAVKQDAVKTIAESREVHLSDCRVGLIRELFRAFLRIFAAQM